MIIFPNHFSYYWLIKFYLLKQIMSSEHLCILIFDFNSDYLNRISRYKWNYQSKGMNFMKIIFFCLSLILNCKCTHCRKLGKYKKKKKKKIKSASTISLSTQNYCRHSKYLLQNCFYLWGFIETEIIFVPHCFLLAQQRIYLS